MFLPLFVATEAVTDVAPAPTPPAPPTVSTPRGPTLPDPTQDPTQRDPTTGQPVPLVDATGQPLTPKDDTGQPIVPKDDTGQILPLPPGAPALPLAPDTLLGVRPIANELDPATAELRLRGTGTALRLHVALIEGYNSNVVQTLSPTTAHPALFTGIDAGIDLLTATSPTDLQVFRLAARGQYYEPLDGYHDPNDGTITGSFVRTFTVSPRTFFMTAVIGTLTSTNSALVSDGPVLVPPASRASTRSTRRVSASRTSSVRAGDSSAVSTRRSRRRSPARRQTRRRVASPSPRPVSTTSSPEWTRPSRTTSTRTTSAC
jgi:hypothetical protein